MLAELPKRKFKSTASPSRMKESVQCSVVSQTLSIGGRVKVERDGLSPKVKSEKVARLGGTSALFAPDKVRVKTEKMVSGPSTAKVKTERSAASQKLKPPIHGSEVLVQVRLGEESVSKRLTAVSTTISPGGNEKIISKLLPADKLRKKAADHAKRRIVESEESSDSDDDAPLVVNQTSALKNTKVIVSSYLRSKET